MTESASAPQAFRALPQPVLADLLRQERDSISASLLRWLLDPEGEHGLGTGLIHRLGDYLAFSMEEQELATALQSDMLITTTDAITRGTAIDVMLLLAEVPKVVLVAARRLGESPGVLDEYLAMDIVPVLVAMSDEPQEMELEVWSWTQDLESLGSKVRAGPAGDLVRQVVAHLRDFPDPPPVQKPQAPSARGAPVPPSPLPLPPAPPALPAAPASPASEGWGGAPQGGGGLADAWFEASLEEDPES